MVDILLATYNGGKFLREQLYSLFSQDFSDFRIIARDDGSDDGTADILEEFRSQFSDRMKIVRSETEKHSAKDNFAELMKHSDAEYVMLCDQDDFWDSNKISVTLDEMKKHPSDIPVLVHTDLAVSDENLNVIAPSMNGMMGFDAENITLEKLLVYNCVTGCTLMMNKALCDIAKNMPDEAVIHDWWIALCAMTFGKIVYIDRPTMLYRQHGGNVVGARRKTLKSAFSEGEKLHRSLADGYRQAEALIRNFRGEIPADKLKIIRGYAIFPKLNKFERAVALTRFGYTKSSAIKTIGQIIFS